MTLLTKEMIKPAKNYWQYFLGIFVMSALFTPLVWHGSWLDFKQAATAVSWSFAIWATQMPGHTIIIVTLNKKISWTQRPLLRGFLGLVSMVVYASVAFILVNTLMNLIFFQELPSHSLLEMIQNSWFAVKISFFISIFVTFIGFFSAWRKAELDKEKLKTQMAIHQYNALQNQLNPHFLFNSFNVLSELVYENQDLAVKFIRQMSDLYRYVLSVKTEDLVSVKRELEFINSFAFLLKTRFENRLQININVAAADDEFLVPMSLQLLLENAVKHNEATTVSPLIISVNRYENHLVVENNLQLKTVVENSTKTGLENIAERYKYLNGDEIEIEKTDKFYRVKLPIIKVE